MQPATTSAPEPRPDRRRVRGLLAVLIALVAASALTAVAARPGGDPDEAAASSARQVVGPPPATTPPPTEAPAPEPVVTSSTATTAAPPPSPSPPSTAAQPPPPPPVPLTLRAALGQAMGGVSGCLIVQDDDTVVFDRASSASFVPASSQKVLVAAAVLSRLGADFRFETKVLAAGPPRDGTLDGAWLVGGGDPFLATPEYAAYLATRARTAGLPVTPLAALADELAARGVRAVPGGLHTDESRYPPQRSVPTWKPSYVTEAEVGSLGALTVNQGLMTWGRQDQRVAPDPAIGAATALGRLLSDRGVTLADPTAGGAAPPDAVLIASVRSAPLGDIVAGMLRASDNYVAEMLVKELDHQSGGPGLTAGGTARVVEENQRLGVPVAGVRLNDGSGLDVGNRATCRALLGALNLSQEPAFAVLDSGLAIAGRTGTLAKRYAGTPAEIVLAAKTGWINGAVAMVGRIAMNPVRRFALLVNGDFRWARAKELQDRIVSVLTSGLPAS